MQHFEWPLISDLKHSYNTILLRVRLFMKKGNNIPTRGQSCELQHIFTFTRVKVPTNLSNDFNF